jgi:hypothetical protein
MDRGNDPNIYYERKKEYKFQKPTKPRQPEYNQKLISYYNSKEISKRKSQDEEAKLKQLTEDMVWGNHYKEYPDVFPGDTRPCKDKWEDAVRIAKPGEPANLITSVERDEKTNRQKIIIKAYPVEGTREIMKWNSYNMRSSNGRPTPTSSSPPRGC